MSKSSYKSIGIAFLLFFIISCKSSVKEESETVSIKTPVETASLRSVSMDEITELSALSVYLKKETVRSSTSGFISEVLGSIGQKVKVGEMIMVIRTKEASAIKSLSDDSTLNIKGLIEVKVNSGGIISQIDHHPGDYVEEGDPLLTITQPGSLVFYLKVPYSEHTSLNTDETVTLLLPDGKKLKGKITRSLTAVDPENQSQDYIIEPETDQLIPENLWVQVPVKTLSHSGNFSLPKACIQSNETQTEFWVMKISNDTIAIKVPITKGIDSDSLTEILSPVFNRTDIFVGKGSYGLSDTARIQIIK
jgi:biotin carboxyl carrier protein